MRPQDKLEESLHLARQKGLEVVAASPLQVQSNDGDEGAAIIGLLKEGAAEVVVLTSTTGVEILDRMASQNGAQLASLLAGCYNIAIGPLTAEAMDERGIRVDMVPEEHSSDGLVRQMGRQLAGKRVYLLRSSHGERSLFDGLVECGAKVSEKVLYRLVPDLSSPELRYLIDESMAGRVDAFAFTSSLSAETYITAAERSYPREDIVAMLNAHLVAAMGGPTRRKLEGMGIRVSVVPSSATFAAMLDGIVSWKAGASRNLPADRDEPI
ncbi:MAG: uroporphyrinogen-III synthase [Methanomassiliicoccales archaeon PtaB.Bin134]|nr:MAG: uroporphyrinogen-III synthase [Methanomassiliicoccales archaeon PtaB.Bin134]